MNQKIARFLYFMAAALLGVLMALFLINLIPALREIIIPVSYIYLDDVP